MAGKIEEIKVKLSYFSRDNLVEKLPLLKKLLNNHYAEKPVVDIERALYMTRYYKAFWTKIFSEQIKRAGAIKSYLTNRKAIIFDENLLGGSTTAHKLGAPLYPEFIGITIWPELDLISKRKANPQFLAKEDAYKLNKEIFPYWMNNTISEKVRLVDAKRQGYLEKFILFICSKQGTLSHTTPCYEIVFKKGINGIIKEAFKNEQKYKSDPLKRNFYKSMQIAMQGIITYALNISKEAARLAKVTVNSEQKKNLQEIARICAKTPANPPESFREAVNCLWLCHVAVLAENSNMAINPGRLDQILYPYFIKDYESGKLTLEEALLICGSLWLKLADNENLVPETAERLFGGAGAVPAITLGGIDRQGKDAVNEATYLFLKVTELLPIRDPNVNARYYPGKNPVTYRDEVSRVIFSTKAIPAFYNDIENIKTLMNQGIKEEDANDYAIIGCVELGSAGRHYSASSSIFMMLFTVLYMALHGGKTSVTGDEILQVPIKSIADFKTFADFWNAYKENLEWMVHNAVELNNTYGKKHQEFLATPLLSCFFEGPMEKGCDLIQGGAAYNSSGVTFVGFADVCDSLCAIYDVCFNPENKEIQIPLEQLIEAVDNNFTHSDPSKQSEYTLLHAYVSNKAPKYGTAHPVARKISLDMVKLNYELFQAKANYRNGNYQLAYWTMTNHAGYGRIIGALPNGRKANEVLASGITPVSQITTDLLTVFNSIAHLKSEYIPNAYALNMKYTPMVINDKTINEFGALVEGYMRKGGQQVQFNIQDYRTLQAAKNNPEHPEYRNLLVRVSGYSAYFRSLNEAMQDELIMRSQYNLETKKLVKLDSSAIAPENPE